MFIHVPVTAAGALMVRASDTAPESVARYVLARLLNVSLMLVHWFIGSDDLVSMQTCPGAGE